METDETALAELLETAIDAGIVAETADGRLRWSDALADKRDAALDRLVDEDEYERVQEAYVGQTTEGESMVTRSVLADAIAVRELEPEIDRERARVLAEAFARFDREEPTDGVPDGFVPIAAAEIGAFLDDTPTSMLYFWREDCAPCREMKARLADLVASDAIPNDVGTAAIYGPSDAAFLRETYQVAIAPTILFTRDGRVDTRHVGETRADVLLDELDVVTASSGDD